MTIAMLCILEAIQGKKILCCREYQNSIQSRTRPDRNLIDARCAGLYVTRDKIPHQWRRDDLQGSGAER